MITVTGATGHLGRLVIDELLASGVSATGIVAAVRSPAKASDLDERGISVRHADYSRPATLDTALAGTDRLLLVSSSEVGQRVDQHRNVIDAAVKAGVSSIAYTSVLHADISGIGLASEHLATELNLDQAGLPYTLLRNSWYIENYTGNLAQVLDNGVILGSAGDGRVAAATRADFAAAAAAVLTTDGHDGAVYELGGDQPFTMSELADTIAEVTETSVSYRDLPVDSYVDALVGFGLPQAVAEILADADAGIARSDLDTSSGDLSRLIGRPTTPLAEAIAGTLAGLNR